MREDELEMIKVYWTSLGFRTVILIDGNGSRDINEGLKAVIRNHISS